MKQKMQDEQLFNLGRIYTRVYCTILALTVSLKLKDLKIQKSICFTTSYKMICIINSDDE